MRPRQPLPRLWLMTDERMGDGLWRALANLPRGAGIVFRHYSTPPVERRSLFVRVRRIARARHLVLVIAGESTGRRADGTHNASRKSSGLRTAAAHDAPELMAARRAGADLVFVSPVYPTRSHPGQGALGPVRFGLLLRQVKPGGPPIIALGGMDARRFRPVSRTGAYGWAAIDAWAWAQGV